MSAVARVLAVEGATTYIAAVEHRLSSAVAAGGGLVSETGAQTLRAGGKRLRPMLTYLCAPPAGRERPELVIAGCAVELVHMATLVHDDQLDRAPLRRGIATVWRKHGPTIATATGDHLFARAFAELVQTGDMAAVTMLTEACYALARGEILQREQAGDPTITAEDYLQRCRLKTGELFSAAARLGGRFGGLDDADLARLGEFAQELGLAFQIADDILDCDGQPDTTGKPLGTDLLDGTVTLPLLLAGARVPDVAAVIARGAQPADVLPTLAHVARSGAVRDARAEAERHADAALELLNNSRAASTRIRCDTWSRARLSRSALSRWQPTTRWLPSPTGREGERRLQRRRGDLRAQAVVPGPQLWVMLASTDAVPAALVAVDTPNTAPAARDAAACRQAISAMWATPTVTPALSTGGEPAGVAQAKAVAGWNRGAGVDCTRPAGLAPGQP